MRESTLPGRARDALALTGLGLAVPAVYDLALSRGWGAGAAGAAATAALGAGAAAHLAAWALRPEAALPWLCGAAALAASGAAVLPAWGAPRAAGLGLLCFLLSVRPRGAGGPAARPGPAWLWAAAAALLVAWSRGVGLLGGPAVPGFAWAAASVFAGVAAALALAPAAEPDAAAVLRRGAGLLALLLPHFLRFLGLNASAAVHLQLPAASAGDLLFLPVQLCVALAAVCAALAASELALRRGPADPGPAGGAQAAAAALAACLGAAAAWSVLARWGAGAAVLAAGGGLAAAALLEGLWSPPARVRGAGPVWAWGLAAAALALGTREPFRDIWLARLDAASPGGRFLVLAEDDAASLGVYRFESGQALLLRDGTAPLGSPKGVARAAHLAMLAAPADGPALVVGAPQPAAWTALRLHRREQEVLFSPSESATLLEGGAPGPAPAGTSLEDLALPGPAYALIFLSPPFPLEGLEARAKTAPRALALMAGRLAPGGWLAVQVAAPYRTRSLAALAERLKDRFKRVGLLSAPGSWLLLAGDGPPPAAASLRARLHGEGFLRDDADLGLELAAGKLAWSEALPPPDAEPGSPLPLAEIVRRRPPELRPATVGD